MQDEWAGFTRAQGLVGLGAAGKACLSLRNSAERDAAKELVRETEELEDEEIRPLVRVRELPEHIALVRDCLVPAFDYLEQRFAAAHAGEQYRNS